MTKDEYLKELKHYLKRLSPKDCENAVAYFTEYFADAGENTEAIMKELGTPKEAARELVQGLLAEKTAEKRQISPSGAILLAITAVFLLPVGAPVLFFGILVIFTAVFLLLSILLGGISLNLALLIQGMTMLFDSITIISHSAAGAAVLAGSGLFYLGVGILFGIAVIWVCRLVSKGLLQAIQKITTKGSVIK